MYILDSVEMRRLFGRVKSIAVVGAKDKPGQPVDEVGRYLLASGYKVFPVHPIRQNVWGLPTFKSLADLPEPADMVNLFRAAEYCPAHAEEVMALAYRPLAFWMQLGIRSEAASAILAPAGVKVIEDKCIMVEHRRIMGAHP